MDEKAPCEMLVKLTTAQPNKLAPDPLQPGVNFINVLQAASISTDPKSVKRY
jgi:hypothetical protein